jgi:Na+/H+ antiporter NhaD/arsenite permease-like protein
VCHKHGMNIWIVGTFAFVYAGMMLGEIPGLALDRSGVALLGALALVATEQVRPEQAWAAVDVPTIALLFGLMVVSAQFRIGGFYSHVAYRLAVLEVAPQRTLAYLVLVAGAMSALLANDIVCLAMAPVLVEGCARRGLNPKPFLLALACAANVGSASTLIGNPQNMLIGQKLGLSFSAYLLDAAVPAALGLVVVWAVVCACFEGRFEATTQVPRIDPPPLDTYQTTKGLVVLSLLVVCFLTDLLPRDVIALTAAAVLLTSRRMASRDILGLVDWHLLVLFVGLFVVNRALADSGSVAAATSAVTASGMRLASPGWLFVVTVVLSNVVSNVPAVMLLLPQASHTLAGPVLALASTLAGNLFIVGSIANIIVVEQAGQLGVRISFREHARVGIPVTVATLLIAALWLMARSAMAS